MTANTFDRIKEAIEANGSVTDKTRNQLLLMAMSAIWDKLGEIDAQQKDLASNVASLNKQDEDIDDRIIGIERVVFWPVRHPYLMGLVVAAALIIANLWFISDFRRGVLDFLNLPTELFPTPVSEPANVTIPAHVHATLAPPTSSPIIIP